jgi:hypothetical protein
LRSLPIPSADRRHRQLGKVNPVDAADIDCHHLGAIGLAVESCGYWIARFAFAGDDGEMSAKSF